MAGEVTRTTSGGGRGVPVPLALGTGSELWLDGTSSIHEYESHAHDMVLTLGRDSSSREPADPASLDALVRASRVRSLEIQIPIAAMRSGKGGLDKNLQKALHAEQYPNIRFRLSHYSIAPASAGRDTAEVTAEGLLSVAGRERTETLHAQAWRGREGVWLSGTQALRMTDFDVKPPTMMLGALKVDDRITIHYRLLLAPTSPAAGSLTNPIH